MTGLGSKKERLDHEVSFVLPAFNEERTIAGVLGSIHRYAGRLASYEVIVVDNGSSDATTKLAAAAGGKVLSMPGGSVGALRNFGATRAQYDNLVFLDADVYLTPEWQDGIGKVLDQLAGGETVVAGSTCGVGVAPGWIEQCWWTKARPKARHNYINSGHMIVRRSVFFDLGGFDEGLKTGEDAEFCQRKRDARVEILHDATLKVLHEGYPKTVGQFFRRERWHALGDYSAWGLFLKSKPALIACGQMGLFGLVLVSSIAYGKMALLWLYPALVGPICLLAAYRRTLGGGSCLVVNGFLYWVYLVARGVALVDTVVGRKSIRSR